MANNCLVTKLKGVVDNDNLPVYGTFGATVKSVDTTSLPLINRRVLISTLENVTVTVKAVGGLIALSADPGTGALINPTDEVTVTGSSIPVYLENKDFKVLISNKYGGLLAISTYVGGDYISIDTEDLKYCNTLRYLSGVVGSGDIANLDELNLVQFSASSKRYVTGDLAVLGRMTDLTTLSVGLSGISGTVEDFVAAAVNAGRTQSPENPSTHANQPISCNGFLGRTAYASISFGGYTDPSYSFCYLEWNDTSRIIIYCSNVGMSGDYNNCKKVYAKGATAEEIAAWERAGKTVIVIE